jgi:serine/threonine protein kinase
VLGDGYEYVRELAKGGMASVHLARKRGAAGFNKLVVVKQILDHFAADERFVQMFMREANLASKLSHPNVVEIYDFGENEGSYYLTMEYVDGISMLQYCQGAQRRGIAVPFATMTKIFSWVAQGLYHAHSAKDDNGTPLGLIHRDISPGNILLAKNGGVKLADFGVAKAGQHSHKTRPGLRKGKLGYMSPEQARGESLDPRSDIFSLGAVLYEATTLRRLFSRKTESQTLDALLRESVPPPSFHIAGYPPPLEAVVMRCLEPRPEERFEDARALHQALEESLAAMGAGTVTAADVSELVGEYVDIAPRELPTVESTSFPVGGSLASSSRELAANTSGLSWPLVALLFVAGSAAIWLTAMAVL